MAERTWTRRRALAALAGLSAAACARGRSNGTVRGSSAAPARFPIVVGGLTPEERAAFAAFAPAVEPVTAPPAGSSVRWEIAAAAPFDLPLQGSLAPLEPALRQVNFGATPLVPGSMAAFAGTNGDHYGVPAYAGPWGVLYDEAVFAQVGLATPAPAWTIDDFERVCATISGAIGSGRLSRLQAVLPPLVGTHAVSSALAVGGMPALGPFNDADLWGAFVAGFGGNAVAHGRFDLTNAGAIAGLQRMADLAARYGPPPATAAVKGPYAMTFAATAGLYASGPLPPPLAGPGRWARFPVLPATPVVPVKVGGFMPLPSSDGLHGVDLAGSGDAGAPLPALVAVAEYALWWYARERAPTGPVGLPPPVLADGAVQRAYWTARGRPTGYPAVGAWRAFAVVEAGWPLVPDAQPSEVNHVGASGSPVYVALTRSVETKVPMAKLVAGVSRQLNSLVAARSTAAGGG